MISVHQFAEKVALISDGSSAIGRAVALQLAMQGSYVITGHANATAADEGALQELKNLGTLADAVNADISTAAGARILVKAAGDAFGRVDLLINCLKFVPQSSFEESTDSDFSAAVDANVRSVYFVTQAAVELMKGRPKPKIVNIISACDSELTRKNVLFAASQAAVAGLTRALAESLPKNFRTNCVSVSDIETVTERRDAMLFRNDASVSPDDVARTVLFLLSGEATGLNGQTLYLGK